MVRRVDAVHRQPVLDIDDVEAQERADLVEGDPALVHETSHESLRDPEPRSEADDVEHPLAIRRRTISFPCHVHHRESTRGTRGSSFVRTVYAAQALLITAAITAVPMSAGERDAVVVPSPEICGACQHPRLRGNHERSGQVFICGQCQADAEQLVRIQDAIWGEPAGEPPHFDGQGV